MPVEVLPEVDPASEIEHPADLRHIYKEEIARALNIICRDSALHPGRYLQETTVPHGGE